MLAALSCAETLSLYVVASLIYPISLLLVGKRLTKWLSQLLSPHEISRERTYFGLHNLKYTMEIFAAPWQLPLSYRCIGISKETDVTMSVVP